MKPRRTRAQWLLDAVAVMSVLAPVTFIGAALQDRRISASPQTAIARVEEKRLDDTGGEGPIFLEVRYSFIAASGARFHGRGHVSQRMYDKLAVGDGLEVQYAADDPSVNRLIGGSPEAGVYYFGIAMIGILWFWFFGLRRWRRELRGEPDPALEWS